MQKQPITAIAIPSEAEMLQIAQLAQAQHLHFITNGTHSALCSIIPKGWHLHSVSVKNQAQVAA